MNLHMSGIDWTHAALELREQASLPAERLGEILTAIAAAPGVEGCVILSTCNRTEIYIDAEGPAQAPWQLFSQAAGLSLPEDAFVSREGEAAVRHLLEVAGGLHSRIFGDDQIITQVRVAMDRAVEAGSGSALLNLLFRTAVTVGKRIKTRIRFTAGTNSAAAAAVRALGELQGKTALVVGNGEMARLAAGALLRGGAQVTMTLRTYHHGESRIPAGCRAVAYADRMAAAEGKDILLTATASPHLTVTAQQFSQLKSPPGLVVDLAVPRDVDPAVRALVPHFWDVDDLGGMETATPAQLEAARAIVEDGVQEVLRWRERRMSRSENTYFPLFIDLKGRRVVLVGGGAIAARRISVLRQFGCDLTVIAPALKTAADWFTWLPRTYQPGDLEGAFLVLAATDDRAVNRAVGEEARRLGILVSVADCMEECTFYFPSICTGGGVVAGVVSSGKSHRKTAVAAKQIRTVLEELP